MKKMIAFLLCAVLLLAGCTDTVTPETSFESVSPDTPTVTPPASPEVSNEVVEVSLTKDNFPKIDGSTANIPMIEAITSVMLGIPRSECAVEVSGTDHAYVNVFYKSCDIAFAYELSAEHWLIKTPTEFATLELAPIGRDALVFLVNAENPIDSLTIEQVQKIYTGEITDWSEVGGDPGEIVAYQRPTESGSQALMDKHVMAGLEKTAAPSEIVIGSMGSLIEAVASYENSKNAIGYNVYYFVHNMAVDERVKVIYVEGVEPSNDTIRTGEYPFVNDFYAIIRKNEKEDASARLLFDWIQSEAGQALMANERYVTLTPQE